MAAKEEIIAGLEMTLAQAKRTTSLFAEGEWDWKRANGWTPKEVYCHLANTAAATVNAAPAVASLPEGGDLLQGVDVDQMNAQALESMASLTPEEVMGTLEANYGRLIDAVKALPDDVLAKRFKFFSDPIPLSDILATNIMVHGLHHVYEAYSRLGASV